MNKLDIRKDALDKRYWNFQSGFPMHVFRPFRQGISILMRNSADTICFELRYRWIVGSLDRE